MKTWRMMFDVCIFKAEVFRHLSGDAVTINFYFA